MKGRIRPRLPVPKPPPPWMEGRTWRRLRRRRIRRIAVAALAVSGVVAVVGYVVLDRRPSGVLAVLSVLAIFAPLVFIGLGWALHDPATFGVFSGRKVDERQRRVRDDAYRRAYKLLSFVLMLTCAAFLLRSGLVGLFGDGDEAPASWELSATIVSFGLLYLPAAIAAWTEPEEPAVP